MQIKQKLYSYEDRDILLKKAKVYPYISVYEPLQNGQKILNYIISVEEKEREEDLVKFAKTANELLENTDFDYLYFVFKSENKNKNENALWVAVKSQNSNIDDNEVGNMPSVFAPTPKISQTENKDVLALINTMQSLNDKIELLKTEKEEKSDLVKSKEIDLEISKINLEMKVLDFRKHQLDKDYELEKFRLELSMKSEQNDLNGLKVEQELQEKRFDQNLKLAKGIGEIAGAFLGLNIGLSGLNNESTKQIEPEIPKPKNKVVKRNLDDFLNQKPLNENE